MHDFSPPFPHDDEDEDVTLPRRTYRLHQQPEPDEGCESPRFRPCKANLVWPCPSCESFRTEPRHVARPICSAVGAAAGAISGAAAALSGAETGAAIGLLGGPVGAVFGSIAGAVLAGLVTGAAGCATGAALGNAIDQQILSNWRCLACGRTFAVRPA